MFRIILIVASIASLYFVPWDILKVKLSPQSNTVQEEINKVSLYGFDGAILYINQKGNTKQYASGWKNRENQIPADPNSLFKIASISKLYIAATVAKLVAADSLSLNKTLKDYLPERASRIENADEITLELLVKHKSGIPDYTRHPDYPWNTPFKTNNETYSLVYDMPADFKPNKKYKYSNTNYLLIGEILDNTLGYSHHKYIRKVIVEKLGLKNTYSLLSEVDLEDVMSGYFVGYEKDVKYNDYINPGGSMVATISDVGVFLRALNDGSLLTEKEQEIYTSIYTFEHTGLLPGYQSIARYHKELDAVIVLFISTSGANSWTKMETLYKKITKIIKKNN
ncbi:serine hydrolase domain-containing protein [Algibacter sp. PT7-4]|uniref:serine hydrolase domain-containing protein n=1 Tax=Algibacter ulvanivorans TaxID=3400999 RepID=UPI003AAAAA1D